MEISHELSSDQDNKKRRRSDGSTGATPESKKTREHLFESDPIDFKMATTGEKISAMSFADQMRAILQEPTTMKTLVEMVSSEVKSEIIELRAKVNELSDELKKKDDEIKTLYLQVEEMQQYSRRNGIRISGYPEHQTEDTDNIVTEIAGKIGVKLSIDDISRSHRIGPRHLPNRQIIVKFVSYRKRREMMTARRQLKDVSIPSAATAKIYINEDLSKQRASLAAKARGYKKLKKIEDTWTSDGIILIKCCDGTVKRLTTEHELEMTFL
jgi:hypothetical protein